MSKLITNTYQRFKSSAEYKNVFKNFGFLTIVQLANYILPIVSLPYLANVLGPRLFGDIMFAQALTQYFIILVDYGFNFSATRDIALNKEKTDVVSEIFSSVLLLKSLLFLLSLIILFVLTFSIDKFSSQRILYFLFFGTVLGNVLFPTWFFQGIQKMKYITLVSVTSKFCYTLFIFLLIKAPEDVLKVPVILSLSSIVPSILGLIHLKRVFQIKFTLPSVVALKTNFKNGWFIFLGSVSSSLYGATNTFLIGLLFNNTYAGYYSFAEKIIRACVSLFTPLNNALYPFMSVKMNESRGHAFSIFKKIFAILVVISAFGMLFVYFGSNLLHLIIEEDSYQIAVIIKILSPLLIVVAINNLIGFQIILTSKKEFAYLVTVFAAGVINILLCIFLSPSLSYHSAAIALLISETIIMCSFLFIAGKMMLKRK